MQDAYGAGFTSIGHEHFAGLGHASAELNGSLAARMQAGRQWVLGSYTLPNQLNLTPSRSDLNSALLTHRGD